MHFRTLKLTVVALALIAGAVSAESADNPGTGKDGSSDEVSRLREELLEKMAAISAQQRALFEQMQAVDQRRRELELIIARVSNPDSYRAGQDPNGPPPEVGAERKAEQQAQKDKPPELPRVSSNVGGVLTPIRHLILEPSLQYIYASSQRVLLDGYTIGDFLLIGGIDVRDVSRDTLVGALSARYGVTDRLEAEVRVPWVNRKDTTRGRPIVGASKDIKTTSTANDFGDVEVNFRYQLPRPSENWPYLVGNLGTKLPTGTDPFKLQAEAAASANPDQFDELPTGSGFWTVSPSLTYIYPSDPVVFFGSFGYLWTVKESKGPTYGEVDPGDAVRMSFGMGFSLNDRSSFSLSYSLDLFGSTDIELLDPVTQLFSRQKIDGSDVTVGKFLLGFSLRLPGGTPLNLAIGIGATQDAPDTDLTFRVPFNILD